MTIPRGYRKFKIDVDIPIFCRLLFGLSGMVAPHILSLNSFHCLGHVCYVHLCTVLKYLLLGILSVYRYNIFLHLASCRAFSYPFGFLDVSPIGGLRYDY